MNNAVLEYYQGIKDGSITVGKWIKLLYEHIVHGIEDDKRKERALLKEKRHLTI